MHIRMFKHSRIGVEGDKSTKGAMPLLSALFKEGGGGHKGPEVVLSPHLAGHCSVSWMFQPYPSPPLPPSSATWSVSLAWPLQRVVLFYFIFFKKFVESAEGGCL